MPHYRLTAAAAQRPDRRQRYHANGQIRRQFRPEAQDFTACWVLDRQYMGMQGLSAKGRQRLLGRLAATARLWSGSRRHRPRRPAGDGRSRPNGPGSGGSGRFRAGRRAGSPPGSLPACRRAAAPVSRPIALQHLPMGDGLAAALADRHAVAAPAGGGRSACRWCRAAGRARPRRRRGSRARTAPPSRPWLGELRRQRRDARGRSSPPPSGRWCPCRAGARCRAAARRRCRRGFRRNGRSAH